MSLTVRSAIPFGWGEWPYACVYENSSLHLIPGRSIQPIGASTCLHSKHATLKWYPLRRDSGDLAENGFLSVKDLALPLDAHGTEPF